MAQAFLKLENHDPPQMDAAVQDAEVDIFAFHPPSTAHQATISLTDKGIQSSSTRSLTPYDMANPPVTTLHDPRSPGFSASPTIFDDRITDHAPVDGFSLQTSHETDNPFTRLGHDSTIPFSVPGPFTRSNKIEANDAPVPEVVTGHLPFSMPGPNTTIVKTVFTAYDTITSQDPTINEPPTLLSTPSPRPRLPPLFSLYQTSISANHPVNPSKMADNENDCGYSAYDTPLTPDLSLPSLDRSAPMCFAKSEHCVVRAMDNSRPYSSLSTTPDIQACSLPTEYFEAGIFNFRSKPVNKLPFREINDRLPPFAGHRRVSVPSKPRWIA